MFILHINSSANTTSSLSRAISQYLVDDITAKYPKASVKHLDLAANPLPFIDDAWVETRHNHLTDDLVDDVLAADLIIIGAPVYNFGVPASLKAYIDQIAIAGKTFQYTPEGPKGLVPAGKKVYIVAASATPYNMLTEQGINYHGPYLKFILGFLGITDVEIMSYSARGEEQIKNTLEQAKKDIKSLVAQNDFSKIKETN